MKAIIFDLDGVLVDSKKAHIKAFKQLCKNKGINLTNEELNHVFGFTTESSIAVICRRRGLTCPVVEWAEEKRQIALKLLKKSKSFPGVESFLKYLKPKYKLALASSSSVPEVEAVLNNLKKYFDHITTREQVKKHKPDPQIYLLTARKLGIKPADCVVIEDSIAGVESAKRAGMFCIAVLNSYPAKDLKSADLIIKDLNDARLRELL